MSPDSNPVGVVHVSPRLVELVERAGVAAGRLSGLPADRLAGARRWAVREQARASARLDASPLTDDTADAVDADGLAAALARAEAPESAETGSGGWAAALRVGTLPTQAMAAREYANLLAVADVEEEVVGQVFDAPLEVMTRLHEVICDGLVAPDAVARLRQTDRAIHDGAQGQMVWAAPPPERLPALMDGLLDWLGGASAVLPTLVVAGVVHERLLEWQPFEAAGGRLARAMARLVRRARGLDPAGLAVPEAVWGTHALRYHREVAATIRRRGELSLWVERTTHAEVVALESRADQLVPTARPEPSERVLGYLGGLADGASVTLRGYATATGVSRERARADLRTARTAGLLADDPLAPGLRYVRLG